MAKKVMCPECDKEVDLEAGEECSNCGINVAVILERDRYERALERLRERRSAEGGGGKGKRKEGWNPFGR